MSWDSLWSARTLWGSCLQEGQPGQLPVWREGRGQPLGQGDTWVQAGVGIEQKPQS